MGERVEPGYSPSREDLNELPMPPEWVAVADGVMPFNQERMVELAASAAREFNEAIIRVTVVLRDHMTPVLVRLAAANIRSLARRRRTGHRHAGTADHRLRYAPARRDVPLGRRTAAKLAAAGLPMTGQQEGR